MNIQDIDINIAKILNQYKHKEIDLNYATNKVKYMFCGKYANGKLAGTTAKESGVPTGQIGCPNCGATLIGEFHNTVCVICERDLFEKVRVMDEGIKLCGRYEECYYESQKPNICKYLKEEEDDICMYDGLRRDVYTTDKEYQILKRKQ